MKKWLCLLLVGVLTFSLTACGSNSDTTNGQEVDISSLPLKEAYAYAVEQYEEHPESHRDICKLQPETQQIIEMDGKYYQSYVATNVDIRYIFISQSEFPDKRKATWDWYTVGTANTYSLDLLGRIDLGRQQHMTIRVSGKLLTNFPETLVVFYFTMLNATFRSNGIAKIIHCFSVNS